LEDGGVKGKDEILTRIDQRMVNQKDSSQMIIEVMQSEMIERNRDVSDVAKRAISKGIVWQKIFTYIMRKKMMKMST